MGGGVAGAIAWGVGPLWVTVVEDGRRVLEEVREDCGFGGVGWGRVLRIGVVELDSDRGYSERINLAGRACPKFRAGSSL